LLSQKTINPTGSLSAYNARMTKRHPDDPKPTWFRLSAESWAMIRTEYLNGATARALAKKYRVSPTSIYRHACQEGWTKEAMAEAVSRKSVADAEREAGEAVAAAKQRDDELASLVERIAIEEDAADIAAAIERRALAQASAAMVQGRSKEAQALASMAEMMRKRAAAAPVVAAPVVAPRVSVSAEASPADMEQRAMAQADAALSEGRAGDAKIYMALAEHMRKRAKDEGAAEEAEQEAFYAKQSEADDMACFIFTKAAYIANAMVHAPSVAPAAFQGLVKLWREHNLGEGEEDAERAAAKLAASQAAYLDGRYEDTLPDYVRERFDRDWAQRRAELESEPPVPQHWAEREEEMRKNGLWTREDD